MLFRKYDRAVILTMRLFLLEKENKRPALMPYLSWDEQSQRGEGNPFDETVQQH
jgi:hypothetical protein